MANRFFGLWHYIIICSNNYYDQVSYLSSAARMAVNASWPECPKKWFFARFPNLHCMSMCWAMPPDSSALHLFFGCNQAKKSYRDQHDPWWSQLARVTKSSGLSSGSSIVSSISAVTNSTVYPNSSATIDKVFASVSGYGHHNPGVYRRNNFCWADIHHGGTTDSNKLCNLEWLAIRFNLSCILFGFLTVGVPFSRRYFAPFDLVVLPCNFSKASESAFGFLRRLVHRAWAGFDVLVWVCFVASTRAVFFVILLRRRFRSLLSGLGFISFPRTFRDQFCHLYFNPVNFLYRVVTFFYLLYLFFLVQLFLLSLF